jgi:hypothetical protein
MLPRGSVPLALALAFVVAAVAPPAALARFEGKVRSIHPGAINDARRNWTYLGDTVLVSFRSTSLAPGKRQLYRVCYTRGSGLSCQTRSLVGRTWDSWQLRILPPWAGYVAGRYVRYVAFNWRVGGRFVAQARVWIYE